MIKRSWQESIHETVYGRWATIYVTINKKGEIRIGRHSFQLMGEPEWVRMLYDRVNLTIGLQPTHSSTKNAYRVGQRGRHRGRIIRAFGFTQEFHIRIEETLRFIHAEIDDDGIMVLDLRKVKSMKKEHGARI